MALEALNVKEPVAPSPETGNDPLTLIADLREKLDALEAALGGGATETEEEPEEPATSPQTDEEIMAGVTPTRKPGAGLFGR